MPSSYAGTRLAFISPSAAPPGTTLSITSGNVTILNGGSSVVTVQDDLGNTVTGCTLVFGDGTKATASGQTVTGTASSGTTTVQATKASYTSSATVTFTCTGTLLSLNADTLGLSNGANVTSWTDSLSNAWANAVNPPTYVTPAVNGHTAVDFNGVAQFLSPAAAISHLNAAGVTVGFAIKMTSTSPASNEQWIRNQDSVNTQGWNTGRATTNFQRMSYYAGVTNQNITSNTSTLTSGNWYRAISIIKNGTQNQYLNGALQGNGRTDGSYSPCTTAPPIPTLGSANAGNYAHCQMSRVHIYNTGLDTTSIAQLDLYLQNWLGQ